MNKTILLGIVPIIVLALIIALFVSYNTKIEQLVLAKSKNTELTVNNNKLKDTLEENKATITKLTVELERTQMLLEEREAKLQELQADVYKEFKNLEALGKNNPSIRNILRHAIPDGLWAEIFQHQEQCDSQDTDNKGKSTASPVTAIQGAGS